MKYVRIETVSDMIDALSKCPGDMKVRRIYDGMVEPLYFEVGRMSVDDGIEFISEQGEQGEKVVYL